MTTIQDFIQGTPAQIKPQVIEATSSTLDINLAKGEYVIVNLAANISTLRFRNWRRGIVNRCIVEFRNTGDFDVLDWGSIKWHDDSPPTLTGGEGTRDIMTFISTTGDVIHGVLVGKNYLSNNLNFILWNGQYLLWGGQNLYFGSLSAGGGPRDGSSSILVGF